MKDGLRLLRSLHLDARELGTVLGEDARAIVKLFLGRTPARLDGDLADVESGVEAVAALLVATPESIVAQLPHDPEPSVASPAEPPALALPNASSSALTDSNASLESSETGGPATRTRRTRTSGSKPEGPGARGEPRRKRRKTTRGEVEVIDLT